MYRYSRYIVVCAGMPWHIECPLLDTILGTVLTKAHVVCSTWLMELQSLYEFFSIAIIRNSESIVFCWWSDRFWIAEIDSMSIWDIGIVGSHSHGDEGASVCREVGATFYLGVCGGDVGESEHGYCIWRIFLSSGNILSAIFLFHSASGWSQSGRYSEDTTSLISI